VPANKLTFSANALSQVLMNHGHHHRCLSPLNVVLKPKHMGAVRASLAFLWPQAHTSPCSSPSLATTYSPVAPISILVAILFPPFPAIHSFFFLSYPVSWLDKHAQLGLPGFNYSNWCYGRLMSVSWRRHRTRLTNHHHMHCLYIITLFWTFVMHVIKPKARSHHLSGSNRCTCLSSLASSSLSRYRPQCSWVLTRLGCVRSLRNECMYLPLKHHKTAAWNKAEAYQLFSCEIKAKCCHSQTQILRSVDLQACIYVFYFETRCYPCIFLLHSMVEKSW
jgi:hypothetical protein